MTEAHLLTGDRSHPVAIDRTALRAMYRSNEEECVGALLASFHPSEEEASAAATLATALIKGVRAHRPSGLDAFLQTFDLTSAEGVALMCLAEALLRIPDADTSDKLIRDKLSSANWREHLMSSDSTFVNATTFALMLTESILSLGHASPQNWRAHLVRAAARLGEPAIREATAQAIKILGGQFVFARSINEALQKASSQNLATYSFDMLGEGAKTFPDAKRYWDSYEGALNAIAAASTGDVKDSFGMSIKLSALHPRYEFAHEERVKKDILGNLFDLARIAEKSNISFTIDAEEADRLELSMDIIEALAKDPLLSSNGWEGFGFALQAYQKRALALCDWTIDLARARRRRLMVRLVKGAYWDAEIKVAQVNGLSEYPVFTQKSATDLSYLCCARKLLGASDSVYSAFATHNAHTVGSICAMAGEADFELQRLHGMGESLFETLRTVEHRTGKRQSRVRVYAPVGSHRDLLAYLVRRLLENGANSSFLNRVADAAVPLEDLTASPALKLSESAMHRNPRIPLPGDIFGARRNSAGVDLSDPTTRAALLSRLAQLRSRSWEARPTEPSALSTPQDIRSPHDPSDCVGLAFDSDEKSIAQSCASAARAQESWCEAGGEHRAVILERAADLYERETDALISLCVREAGKTIPDAILEVREAVDFLRFYAEEARRLFSAATTLPGPTGEQNETRLVGRGVFAAIAPWNFPLAIFTGPLAAALAAGNSVVAKPAEQTPLIAAFAVSLLHEAGVPKTVLQLVIGGGTAGAALVANPHVKGVAFTGSTATAKAIQRTLAARELEIIPLIAETGGQNALIVDSSALPEQVTRDVIASAFQSAGQRCSALRVLFLQEDVADAMLEMIVGALDALIIGDPQDLRTDVGPVIDAEAKAMLDAHIARLKAAGRIIRTLEDRLPSEGTFVAPTIAEISAITDLDREVFGPVLHVVRYKASELDAVLDSINATGYGLTLGLHSRIESTRRLVERRAKVGNLYVNRNQIGAVVESQPFGGEGLSGTGPKAGGRNYVVRFAVERTVCIDVTAAGGNATLLQNATA